MMGSIKKDVVYAWMFEQLDQGTITDAEVSDTYNCSSYTEWLTRVKRLASKANDTTPIEILTGNLTAHAAE